MSLSRYQKTKAQAVWRLIVNREPPYWWCQLTIKGQTDWALLLVLNLLLILSHFFYYGKSRNGKRNPFANVKWFAIWCDFFLTFELFISHLLLKLRDKYWHIQMIKSFLTSNGKKFSHLQMNIFSITFAIIEKIASGPIASTWLLLL